MSLWQFSALSRGWKAANCPDDSGGVQAPSEAEYEAALERFGGA